MLLLYLSIIIIVLGIVFLLTSIEVRTVRVDATNNVKEKFLYKQKQPQHLNIYNPGATHNVKGSKEEKKVAETSENKRQEMVSGNRQHDSAVVRQDTTGPIISAIPDKGAVIEESKKTPEPETGNIKEEKSLEAILFEDRNAIIDFESDTIHVEMDHALYQNLKRIGKGEVSVRDDAVYFHCEKKLYRYDFSRVQKVSSKGDAILLHVDTIAYPILFIGEPGQNFVALFMEKYSLAKQG